MSTTALATLTRSLATRLNMGENDNELIATLKATAFRSDKVEVTDSQMTALIIVANQYGLNPWTKEIYAFPDKKNGIIPVVGVDGWSRIINENPQFDGMEFTSSEKMVRPQGAKADAPEWMECTIYRKDRTHPTVIREYLDEVYRDPFKGQYGDTIGPWQTHPKRFLRHKTMIQCSRIAFGYVGIFDKDEAERIAEIEINPREPASETALSQDVYTAEQFDTNFPKWKSLIESGKQTPDDIIKKVQSKAVLCDEHLAEIRAIAAHQPAVIHGDVMTEEEIQAAQARELEAEGQ